MHLKISSHFIINTNLFSVLGSWWSFIISSTTPHTQLHTAAVDSFAAAIFDKFSYLWLLEAAEFSLYIDGPLANRPADLVRKRRGDTCIRLNHAIRRAYGRRCTQLVLSGIGEFICFFSHPLSPFLSLHVHLSHLARRNDAGGRRAKEQLGAAAPMGAAVMAAIATSLSRLIQTASNRVVSIRFNESFQSDDLILADGKKSEMSFVFFLQKLLLIQSTHFNS
jgi:hypothetical protein